MSQQKDQYKDRCQHCVSLVLKAGKPAKWTCDKSDGKDIHDIRNCPEGLELEGTWKKIEDPLNSKTYRQEEINLAISFCPRIYPCQKCGHPVVDGYCCQTCGDGDPHSKN